MSVDLFDEHCNLSDNGIMYRATELNQNLPLSLVLILIVLIIDYDTCLTFGIACMHTHTYAFHIIICTVMCSVLSNHLHIFRKCVLCV